jgi:hypothetical protein
MVEEDRTHNVVNDDAMDIGEVSNKTSPVPSPEHSTEPSPVPSPKHTHVPSPEHTREACPVTSSVPSPMRTSVPSPVPSCAATLVPSPKNISHVQSPSSGDESPRIKSPSKYPAGFWDDVPKMDLFPDGSEEAKFFATIPDVAATSGGSCVVVTPVRKEDVPQPIVPAGIFLYIFFLVFCMLVVHTFRFLLAFSVFHSFLVCSIYSPGSQRKCF